MLPGFRFERDLGIGIDVERGAHAVEDLRHLLDGVEAGVPPPKKTVSMLRPPTASRHSDASLMSVSAYDGIMCSCPAYELKSQ